MTGSRIIPGLRYHDAPAAIDWLCEALGFEKQLVVEHEGTLWHFGSYDPWAEAD